MSNVTADAASAYEGRRAFVRRTAPILVAAAATVAQLALAAHCSRSTGEGLVTVVVSRGLRKGERFESGKVEPGLRMEAPSAEAFVGEADVAALAGRYVARQIPPGFPIPLDLLVQRPVLGVDADSIPPGRVLFPLPVRLGALASFMEPGSKVDVLAHMSLPDSGLVTETILERATVVSVGERPSEEGRSEGDVVSFHLTHEEAKLLVYAQKFSEFVLALRNPKETGPSSAPVAMTLNRFLANPRIRAALADDVFQIRRGEAAR